MLGTKAAMKILFALTLIFCISLLTPTVADDEGVAALGKKRVDAAVKKAVEYLKGLQQGDGSWAGDSTYEKFYPMGTTALVLFAVIKGGEGKDSDCVKKALSLLKGMKDFPGTYSTSCLILALVALVETDEDKEEEEPGEKGEKKGWRTEPVADPDKEGKKKFRKAPPWLKAWIQRAVNYIVRVRTKTVWRYPGGNPGETGGTRGVGGDRDASATQFVMMALFAARRIGINAPQGIYPQVAEYYMRNQEDKGPKVKGFPVPGADINLKDVKDMEKRWRKEINKKIKEAAKKAKKEKEKFTGVDPRTIPREVIDEKYGNERADMEARGWTYLPKEKHGTGGIAAFMSVNTGTMTASGVIACMLCKAELEGTSYYKKNGKRLRKAIRDGLGWISHNWTISQNPNTPKEDSWRYYYYYALERAGVLTLVHKVGTHDWYKEIGERILSEQSGDGSWAGASAAPEQGFQVFQHGPTWNTSFAILFLKRATTPLIREKTIFTGGDYLGRGKKDKEKKEEKEEE
ncbi:MAG: hypothetical protein E3J72_07230 [Planctomycetota bacterium]|nr:MAG: hypothetical protein E3J72_07230 [Planctomycetota bacterium]